MNYGRLTFCISLCLIVAACSYHYDLKAVERNGKIAFEPKKEQHTGCISDLTVTRDTSEIVWRLDAGRYLPPPCENKFPITYGDVPQGLTEKVKAAPLRAGTVYKVEAWDGDSYSGTFKFRQALIVETIDAH